jgi:hypothetical protein
MRHSPAKTLEIGRERISIGGQAFIAATPTERTEPDPIFFSNVSTIGRKRQAAKTQL